jgi:hypothetical protein
MTINDKMAVLLKERGISMPFSSANMMAQTEVPKLVEVDGSILMKTELDRATSVMLTDFPDRTGFEAFVNHVHFPLDDDRESLLKCLTYATNLQGELKAVAAGRRFLIIVSVQNAECVVRFHQVRPNESWVSKNLEGYEDEGILLLPVESSNTSVP